MLLSMLFTSLHSLTDEQLMQRVSEAGDDKAYSELYRRHSRRLMGFFYRQMGKDEALASDLTQDAFMRVWSHRQSYGGTTFLPWLFTIAYNLCRNHYRHLNYEQAYAAEATFADEGSDTDLPSQTDTRLFDEALHAELNKLPPPTRLLFSLRFEEELTIPQIAAIIGIPEGTIKSRLHSLTITLRQKLKHYDQL